MRKRGGQAKAFRASYIPQRAPLLDPPLRWAQGRRPIKGFSRFVQSAKGTLPRSSPALCAREEVNPGRFALCVSRKEHPSSGAEGTPRSHCAFASSLCKARGGLRRGALGAGRTRQMCQWCVSWAAEHDREQQQQLEHPSSIITCASRKGGGQLQPCCFGNSRCVAALIASGSARRSPRSIGSDAAGPNRADRAWRRDRSSVRMAYRASAVRSSAWSSW